MRWPVPAGVLALLTCVPPHIALAAQGHTLESYIPLIKSHAPAVVAARTGAQEARAGRVGASPLLGQNPSVATNAGGIVKVDGFSRSQVDWGGAGNIQLNVPVEVAGQRGLRLDVVQGRVGTHDAMLDAAVQAAVLDGAEAFERALHAQRVVEMGQETLALARRVEEAARHRQAAGMGTALDVELANLDVVEASRALAGVTLHAQRLGRDLAARVGMAPEELGAPQGALLRVATVPNVEDAVVAALRRPDVRAVQAARETALREARLARADAIPSPTFNTMYQYWNREHALLAGVTVPLPVFVHGQGEEAKARARAAGLGDEAAAREEQAAAQVRAAHAHLAAVKEARAALEAGGLGASPEALEARLETQFMERKVDLGTLLTVRRRVLQARRDALDLELEEALATLWLHASMGVLP